MDDRDLVVQFPCLRGRFLVWTILVPLRVSPPPPPPLGDSGSICVISRPTVPVCSVEPSVSLAPAGLLSHLEYAVVEQPQDVDESSTMIGKPPTVDESSSTNFLFLMCH